MNRIASSFAFDKGLSTIQQRQRELTEMQEQLTSGKRVARASDDPVAAARAERALANQARSLADQRSLEASRNAMEQAESSLGAANEKLLYVRDLVVSAGNGTYSDAERLNIANAIRGVRLDLLAVANRGDGAGGYLFGGQGSRVPPFTDLGGGVVGFNGSSGAQQVAGVDPLPTSMDGNQVWLQAPPANGVPGPSVSVFVALHRIADELALPGRTGAQIAQTVADGLRDIDAVSANLSSHRAFVGETLIQTDSVEVRLSQQGLAAAAERSAAEDLDMVQAISGFQNQQTGYDAALKAYSMVQRLSLFQYIGN